MIKLATVKLTASASMLLALSACISFGPKVPPSLLNLTSAATFPSGEARRISKGEAIAISIPFVPQAYAGTRIAVISGATAIAYVKDAQWVEPPARLFQRLLAETVSARTGKAVLDPRQFPVAPGIQLGGQVKTFGIVVSAERAENGNAVIVYDATLSSDLGEHLITRRFEAKVPVAKIDAAQSGTALNQAANQIASDVAAWIATT